MTFRLPPSGNDSVRCATRLVRSFWAAFPVLAGALTASAQPNYSSPYNVSTYAGGGEANQGYLDGTGTAAEFNTPYGVAVDTNGNVYVADSANYVIRKIASGGAVTTLAGHAGVPGTGDGTGTAAQFGSIRGIALDGSGNLFVTDFTHGTVRKVVIASGAVTTFVPASAGLNEPAGIAVDGSGTVYVADSLNYVVRRITPGGTVGILAGSVGNAAWVDGSGTSAQFNFPTGLAADGNGNLYVTDGNTIRKIAVSTAAVTTIAGVTDHPAVADGPVSGTTYVNHPYGIAADSGGDLFFTDSTNLVREISSAGIMSTLAGEQGISGSLNGVGENAWFNTPAGIAAGSNGTIYVADTINNEIRMGVPYNLAQRPQIQNQPQSEATTVGATVILQIAADPPTGVSYQWQFNGNNLSDGGDISGSLTNTLTITGIATSQAGNYTVVVTNSYGSTNSNPAVVTVGGGSGQPGITVQPVSQSVNAGASVTLTAAAAGATSYQWQLNGTAIPGATNTSLALANIATTQRGSYTLVASNPSGSTASNAAKVAVTVNSFLYNISTVGYVGSGANQDLDAGFYTNGSGAKNIVVRGIGPNLAVLDPKDYTGLTLASPDLVLNSATSPIATNTAWGGGPTLTSAFATVYAAAFQSASNDTAIFTSVPAGPGIGYTADVKGSNGGTGVAQIEVYDYDSYVGTPASHLINISTRGYVGTGLGTGAGQFQFLDAGFWTIGGTSETVLIRAVGPGEAANFPGQNLAKPELTLYDSSGKIIATNAGWGSAPVQGNSTVAAGIQQATAAIMNSVYASPFAAGSGDCAMVVTLPANAGYTAKVTSSDSASTGIALVEVYDVP